ncbi:MAG: DUF1007 family protein [Pseudomonadota bacterium]
MRYLARACALTAATIATLLAAVPREVNAHPHVFVDGGVDFVLAENSTLQALEVTWIFDAFETLYILAAAGHAPTASGDLDAAARRDLTWQLGAWLGDFSGSAHLSVDGEQTALDDPVNLNLDLTDGRLQLTFTRRLASPQDIGARKVEVAFYEATYFYAFSATKPPIFRGDGGPCSARVNRFNPDTQLAALQSTLFDLSREETPEMTDVGALFADRIVVKCE